jgi:hypothetical protein
MILIYLSALCCSGDAEGDGREEEGEEKVQSQKE